MHNTNRKTTLQAFEFKPIIFRKEGLGSAVSHTQYSECACSSWVIMIPDKRYSIFTWQYDQMHRDNYTSSKTQIQNFLLLKKEIVHWEAVRYKTYISAWQKQLF